MNDEIKKILKMFSYVEIVDLIRDFINDEEEINYWEKWGVSKQNREVLIIETALRIRRRLTEKINNEILKENVL